LRERASRAARLFSLPVTLTFWGRRGDADAVCDGCCGPEPKKEKEGFSTLNMKGKGVRKRGFIIYKVYRKALVVGGGWKKRE